jgi:hypothetical protein
MWRLNVAISLSSIIRFLADAVNFRDLLPISDLCHSQLLANSTKRSLSLLIAKEESLCDASII